MAGQSKPIIGTLQRGRSLDINRSASLRSRDLFDILGYLGSVRAPGVHGAPALQPLVIDGLQATAQSAPNMSVQVAVGIGFAQLAGTVGMIGPGIVQNNQAVPSQDSNWVMLNKRTATASVVVTAAAASRRYDLIEVAKAASATTETEVTETVDVFNAGSQTFNPLTNQVTVSHGEPDVIYTAGTPGAGIPAPTAGRVPIAVIRVNVGAVSITQDNIFDARVMLSEFLGSGPGSFQDGIEGCEIFIDRISNAGAGSNFLADAQVQVVAGATPGSFRSEYSGAFTVMSWNRTSATFSSICDRLLLANLNTNSANSIAYCYLVTRDDQGFRLSSSTVRRPDATFAGYDHVGWLVWSGVSPNNAPPGILMPSSAIALPAEMGNGNCTPGIGSAICVGFAMIDQSTDATRGQFHGLQLSNGTGKFYAGPGTTLPKLPTNPAIPTWVPATAANPSVSSLTAQWDPSAPQGALSFDVLFPIITFDLGTFRRQFAVYSTDASGNADVSPIYSTQDIIDPNNSSTSTLMTVPGMRCANFRGGSFSGFFMTTSVFASGSAAGGFFNPATWFSAKILGYRWPMGPVVARLS